MAAINMHTIEHITKSVAASKPALDGVIGGMALSSPMWWGHFETAMQSALLIGGVVLVVLRVLITWKEYRKQPE